MPTTPLPLPPHIELLAEEATGSGRKKQMVGTFSVWNSYTYQIFAFNFVYPEKFSVWANQKLL